MSVPPTKPGPRRVPLLGKAEKGQLEEMILERLQAHFDAHGPAAMLGEKLRVAVTAQGAQVDLGETADPLAAVEVRSLFTALCYLTAGSPAMPRDALEALATEATSACAAQINKIAAD
ncbi:MAG TPA: hypothetical protein VM073_01465 [Usitatibacter sp.]|nr:hypothetical protein [Usitatibacter sp.]